jgi:hypothetical protein
MRRATSATVWPFPGATGFKGHASETVRARGDVRRFFLSGQSRQTRPGQLAAFHGAYGLNPQGMPEYRLVACARPLLSRLRFWGNSPGGWRIRLIQTQASPLKSVASSGQSRQTLCMIFDQKKCPSRPAQSAMLSQPNSDVTQIMMLPAAPPDKAPVTTNSRNGSLAFTGRPSTFRTRKVASTAPVNAASAMSNTTALRAEITVAAVMGISLDQVAERHVAERHSFINGCLRHCRFPPTRDRRRQPASS